MFNASFWIEVFFIWASILLSDSVRAFKQRMKLGQFAEVDEEEKKRKQLEKEEKEQEESRLAAEIKSGDRWDFMMALV